MKIILNAVLFALLFSIAPASFAEYINDAETLDEQGVIADLLIVRPLGVVGSAAGIVIQGFGLLFSVPGENFGETGEILVEDPLNYTFNRPLGRFEEQN